jgi:hypothetical protein
VGDGARPARGARARASTPPPADFSVNRVESSASLLILVLARGAYWVCDEHPRTVPSLEEQAW